MSRNLTRKQSEFAEAVAQGAPLAQAYRTAYRPKDPTAPSIYPNSQRALKHPGIATRIKELQLELLPAPEDMRAVYAHGLATIIQLSITSDDGRVRLRAAEWLCAEAEKREKLEAARPLNQVVRPRDEREAIIRELSGLYRKALPDREPPLVEAVGSAETAGEAEGMPAVGLEPLSEFPAQGEQVYQDIDAAEDSEEFCSAAAPPPERYTTQRMSPPGHFPPKFRKVSTT